MRNVGRKLAFVLAASNHGAMIVNRLDYRMREPGHGYGVGYALLESGSHDPVEIELALQLIEARRRFHGDGVVAVDCGANIGVHTIEWAIAMTGWGSVMAIEAQERLYYALAGNIALNNCFNAIAMHAAVSSSMGVLRIPNPDYLTASSFGSLELKPRAENEYIGQPIDYSDEKTVAIPQISLDSLELTRVDLIKLDIEGMELEALEGAQGLIERNRPIVLVETIKTGAPVLRAWLETRGYRAVDAGMNLLAIHRGDPTLSELKIPEQASETPAQSSAA
jgi:FkbM family methyltransferase